jgi:hypothetical protein
VFLCLLYIIFGDLSDALGNDAVYALVSSVPLIIVLNGLSRVGIAPDLSSLTGFFHLLDKVLAIGRGSHGHASRVRMEGAAAKGAGEGGGRGEEAGVARLTHSVKTAKGGDWLLG